MNGISYAAFTFENEDTETTFIAEACVLWQVSVFKISQGSMRRIVLASFEGFVQPHLCFLYLANFLQFTRSIYPTDPSISNKLYLEKKKKIKFCLLFYFISHLFMLLSPII